MRCIWSCFVVLAVLLPVPDAAAHTQPKAKIALHTQFHVRKATLVCGSAESGGFAPTDLPCTQFEAAGDLKQAYNVYLVVSGADTMYGLGGMTCGLDYEAPWGEGIDILNWYLCGDLEVRGTGPNGIWPAAGSGNMVLWPNSQTCQTRSVPGYENEGVHAVAGAFYVYAYGPDTLSLTPNNTRTTLPRLTVSDCQAMETEIQESVLGSAVFGIDDGKGCNPCLEPCAPIPQCEVAPTEVDFGLVPLQSAAIRGFEIRNPGTVPLRGIVDFSCIPDFYVLEGGGPYILPPGETRKVIVGFFPRNPVRKVCTQYVANRCGTVRLVGEGIYEEANEGEDGDFRTDSPPSERFQGIRFRLPLTGPVRLLVFDVTGRRRHVEEWGGTAGWNELRWDAGNLPSGMYFYRLEHPAGTITRKFLLLR